MNPLHIVRLLKVLAAVVLVGASLNAQDLQKGVTDLSHVDADYHDQGEYVGSIRLEGACRPVGLQVVALGEGKFDGLIHRGGLPGSGYDRSSRLKLTGSRTGDSVVIGGENLVVVLKTGFAATVRNPEGQLLGDLQPIKRVSPTSGLQPSSNAIVLFNGQVSDRLNNAKLTPDGFLEVGCETKDAYQNFILHAEFRTPYMPFARGQGRGNSGFYLQKRYEVQVLDSFGLEQQNNDCGSLYKFKAPDLNMSFPPLQWQTYDITFHAPKFDSDNHRIAKGRITVRHNGVVIHDHLELDNKTGGGSIEGPTPLPILFQNHNNPVQFRNIWLIDLDQPTPLTPAYPSLIASNGAMSGSTCLPTFCSPKPHRRFGLRR